MNVPTDETTFSLPPDVSLRATGRVHLAMEIEFTLIVFPLVSPVMRTATAFLLSDF